MLVRIVILRLGFPFLETMYYHDFACMFFKGSPFYNFEHYMLVCLPLNYFLFEYCMSLNDNPTCLSLQFFVFYYDLYVNTGVGESVVPGFLNWFFLVSFTCMLILLEKKCFPQLHSLLIFCDTVMVIAEACSTLPCL